MASFSNYFGYEVCLEGMRKHRLIFFLVKWKIDCVKKSGNDTAWIFSIFLPLGYRGLWKHINPRCGLLHGWNWLLPLALEGDANYEGWNLLNSRCIKGGVFYWREMMIMVSSSLLIKVTKEMEKETIEITGLVKRPRVELFIENT